MPRISIYIRILVFFSLLVFVPVVVTTYVNYRTGKEQIEGEYRRELSDFVNQLAPQLDGDQIKTIQDDAEESFIATSEIIKAALQARGKNPTSGDNPVFVFRRADESSLEMEYAVMTTRDRSGHFFVGKTRKETAMPQQRAGFNGDSTVTGIYTDEWGTWISAIAPIYDGKNQVVAILQGNLQVTELYNEVQASLIRGLKTAFLSFCLCAIPALLFARSLVKPLTGLVEATQRFAANELEYRVRSKRKDELGDLAKSFDWMAEQLLVDRLKRVETEASLRNSEAEARKLALVAGRTHNSVVIMDAEGRIEWVNDSFQRITGYELDDVEGKRLIDTLEGENTDAVAAKHIRDEVKSGHGFTEELIQYRKDGNDFWSSLEMQPVRNTEGNIVNYVAVQSDITERKRAAEELGKAKDDAETANKAKSEFLAVMSHEIRTPMNGILGFTNLLLSTKQTSQQHDYTETIQSSGESLLTLLNDILDFSKIESGRMEMEHISFELRQCVEETLDLIAAQAARKKLEVIGIFDADLPSWFVGDVTRIRQIIVNLCGNAVKFTDHGEISCRVSGRQTKTIDDQQIWELHFHVKDTGVGIPKDRREKLFKPFSQVDSSITRKYGGTGLGLVICRRLCELMKGRIWVESEEGSGSDFQFTIQIPAEESQKPEPWELQKADANGRKVLVVDDNSSSLAQLSSSLKSWAMTPFRAATISEADKLITENQMDLMLFDASLLNDEGQQFVVRHAQVPSNEKGIPVVMMGAVGDEAGIREILGERCRAVINKPVHQSLLFNCIIEITCEGSASKLTTIAGSSLMDASLGDRIPLKILLAEDNLTNQKLAILTLKQMGYHADIAENGAEALKAVQREAYDLILMDVQMPEMDGLEATRRIRDYEEEAYGEDGHRTRILAMTANATVGDKEKCLEVGMDDYISKPVRPDALQRALVRGRTEISIDDEAGKVRRRQTIAAAEAAIQELCEALEPEGVIEMAESFMKDVPDMIAELKQAGDSGTTEQLERAAHSLKGAAGIF
ncbi:MAG: response regulator, partial [Limisphaerales bacterium]